MDRRKNLDTESNIVKHFNNFYISTLSWVEEEEEACTAMDMETAITADEVDADDIINLVLAAQLRKHYAMLSATAYLTTVRSRTKTKQEHHGRNSCNKSAQIRSKI